MQSPYPKRVYKRNAEVYKLLAHPKRLEILNIIRYREATVDTLAEVLSVAKANVSQHLTLLRFARLVTVRREGRNAYYKIADPRIVEPCAILRKLFAGESKGKKPMKPYQNYA
jgi:ArsR family transcriptional regulator, virulence genes transcriptional regulator